MGLTSFAWRLIQTHWHKGFREKFPIPILLLNLTLHTQSRSSLRLACIFPYTCCMLYPLHWHIALREVQCMYFLHKTYLTLLLPTDIFAIFTYRSMRIRSLTWVIRHGKRNSSWWKWRKTWVVRIDVGDKTDFLRFKDSFGWIQFGCFGNFIGFW